MKKANLIISLSLLVILLLLNSCKKEEAPSLITSDISELTESSATCGGVILSSGDTHVSSKGVCWSTIQNPTVLDHKTTDGIGSDSFTSKLTGLDPATLYYARAYAINSDGIGYGTEIEFTTLGSTPGVGILVATNITSTAATIHGTINPNRLSTAVSFEYGTTISYGQNIQASASPLTGNSEITLSSILSGLDPNTTYHVRLKAVNVLGITYCTDMTFKTLGGPPIVSTANATNIASISATLHGTVNPNWLSTSVSFEYGTTISYGHNIQASTSPVTGNSGINLSSILSGLDPNTTYHIRLRAENSQGISYGTDMTFKTLGGLPIVSPPNATDISSISATLHGTVNPNWLSTSVTFEYGITTSYEQNIQASTGTLAGNLEINLSKTLSGLDPNTTYHFRIRAENSQGISYSTDMTFKTLNSITDVDGFNYDIVVIGNQEWLANNLKTTRYRDGSVIPLIPSSSAWASCTTGAYSSYDNNNANVSNYGALYNWYAVVDSRGLCPAGWHVPTNDDWATLTTYLGDLSVAGGKMKETGTGHWASPNTGADNSSGFTGIGAGSREYTGSYYAIKELAYMWSSTEYSSTHGIGRKLFYNTTSTSFSGNLKQSGFSVRCIKD